MRLLAPWLLLLTTLAVAAPPGADQLLFADSSAQMGQLVGLSFRDAGGLRQVAAGAVDALVVGPAPGGDVLRGRDGSLAQGELVALRFQTAAGVLDLARPQVLAVSVGVGAAADGPPPGLGPGAAAPGLAPPAPAAAASVPAVLQVSLQRSHNQNVAAGWPLYVYAYRKEDGGNRRTWRTLGPLEGDPESARPGFRRQASFMGPVSLPPGPWEIQVDLPAQRRHKTWSGVVFEPGHVVQLGYHWRGHTPFGHGRATQVSVPLPGF